MPVPIRLRDAKEGLNFETLAKERFIAEVATASISDAEAERVWRELRKDDQIVVLADGLEEALDDADGRANGSRTPTSDASRDNVIHLAMREARRDGLPLVVASRPHDALVGLDAAVIELENLGEEAALEYIEHGHPGTTPIASTG